MKLKPSWQVGRSVRSSVRRMVNASFGREASKAENARKNTKPISLRRSSIRKR